MRNEGAAVANPELGERIAREKAELAAAPVVKLGPPVGRCHFCGQLSKQLRVIQPTHPSGMVRYKGGCCDAKQ
jgi:hypothetical protein